MRITNKIIQNNAIKNLNTLKTEEDRINTQLATGKKISRASEDPVTAIRALRLRTSLSEVEQYYERNCADAESWLSLTEDAINTTIDLLTDMRTYCATGVNGFNTSSDRSTLLESLKQLRDEIYATGDSESAGRYLFTGYRTSTSLTFGSATSQTYSITEQLTSSSVSDITYVDTAGLLSLTDTAALAGEGANETEVATYTVHRLQLAYSNCDSDTAPTISYYDSNGELQTVTANIVSLYDEDTDAYLAELNSDGISCTYIPETGELILSDELYAALNNTLDDASTTDVNEATIFVTYNKTEWASSDLRPEHYFYCESNGLVYNESYLDPNADKQVIAYDVGFGQSLQVNTLASELYTHDIARTLDDIISAMENVIAMEDVISRLEDLIADTDEDDEETLNTLQLQLDAANKALTYLEEVLTSVFEQGLSDSQDYLDQANQALTTVGNRSSRLTLIENRLSSQQSNLESLTSDNEDVDITVAAVELSSVQLSYEAALLATSKIAQTTLLSYL